MSSGSKCAVHFEEEAAAVCASCGRPMCDECWAQDVDDRPWCEPCVALLREPSPIVVYVGGALAALGLVFVAARRLAEGAELEREIFFGVMGVALVMIAMGTYRLRGRAEASRKAHRIAPRGRLPSRAQRQSAYRGRLRRLTREVAPPVSGVMVVPITVLLFALVAGVVPRVLGLPRWVEWELVVAGWWVVWAGTFTVLLYRGWRVADDAPDLRRGRQAGSRWNLGKLSDIGDPGCSDPEGCLVALALLVALVVALALAWILVELVLPVVLVAAYWLLIRALSRVANDRHECEGQLGRSLAWGGLWALVYTAPLAGIVALGHAILTR